MNVLLPKVTSWITLALCTVFGINAFSQATVFSDDFTTSAGTAYSTAAGAIGTSPKWSLTRSGTDFGSRINSGLLTQTNDATGTANVGGWVLASANTAGFASPYNTTLGLNPGMVTWTFNMQQIRTNPKGFATSNYGSAYILAGSTGTTNVTGTGYAVLLGSSGSVDPIRLVRYTAGIRTSTTLITSNTTGLTDFGNQYLSIKVTYTPTTNMWQLYVRNDGATFADPAIGTLTSQGTIVNNSYTTSALLIMGCYWNASTNANQNATFDNTKVTVAVPTITSISPGSRTAGTGAFVLTVNGSNFINGTSMVRWNGLNRATSFVSATQLTASILAGDITTSGAASITIANAAAISNSQTFTVDPAGAPSLTLSTNAISNQSTVTGTASSPLAYTISGANLTADPVVAAPANFEVSSNGSAYFASLTLARSGNTIAGQPLTLSVRLKASAPAGIYSSAIDHTVTGGAPKQVAVTGTVLASQPTTAATGINFSAVTSTGFTINWTNGNGNNHLVLVKSASDVNSAPIDGSSYAASPTYPSGAELGTGNFIVYSGSGNTVTISGLTPATVYHIAIYGYNGTGGTENYINTSPAIGNRTTINAPIGWQIYATNTINTINFDTTVDGVNADAFQGDGLAPNYESGELNSNAWAVTGFSDGNIPFGSTYTEDQDYDRGPSEGGVTTGGVYAFETSNNNFSLGIQPAAGDFAPGNMTLRIQNQTGATVTSINIGYKVYVYNDEQSSSSFNFSYSTNGTTFTDAPGLNVISPAAAQLSPGWKAYYRVITLTGLSIASNNYYYVRWSGATVSGAVEFDEFALDDIVLVANPTTAFVPFQGNAETFSVQGNAVLSADMTVNGDILLNAGKVDINGNTLTLKGNIINTISGGIKGSASSSLIISGAVNRTVSLDLTTLGTTNSLNNFTVNTIASNTVTIATPLVVNSLLAIASGQTLNLGTHALTGALSTITNNGTIQTQNLSALPLPSGTTWGGSGTINYNSAISAQTLVVGTYHNLTISTPGGAIAAGGITVNGVLDLPVSNPSATMGCLSMGTHTLTMGGASTNTGIGDVTGIITRNVISNLVLYTFGNTHTSIIFPIAGTLPTSMSLKVAIGVIPTWRTGAIKRTYDFIQSGAANTKAVIKAHYLDSELNGNVEGKLVDWAYIVSSNTTLEQGRSNYDTAENWVELTNVNVGLYFAPVFDAVRLTLDESEAGSLTWNGSVSNSWTTATNWTPNATPSDASIVYIPDAATTPNDPSLNPAVLLGALNIMAGGILNAPNDSQFTLNSGAGAWINDGLYNPGGGTSRVIFTNLDATIAGTTNFNNITINSGAGLRPLTNCYMRIAGAFVNNGSLSGASLPNTVEYAGTNQIIATPTSFFSAYDNLIINGTGAVFPSSLNIKGNFTLNQPVDFAGKTVVMIGSELQSISGTAAISFFNLTLNNLFGTVNLMSDATINGSLALTAGNLNISNYILTLNSTPVSGTFDSSHMIAMTSGEVRRKFTATGSYTFPIGELTGTADYSPITISVNGTAFTNAYVAVSVTDAIHPNNYSTENNISRYWKVRQSGITAAVITATAGYIAADIVGNENNIAAAQLKGTFNQQSNPWIKHSALANLTLTATAAPLSAGQESIFTGIKGEVFAALVSGYGSFCQNELVTLSATPSGGDAPYTYLWSAGLGALETASPPTAIAGTTNYTVTITDSNGITASDQRDVVVLTPSVGGILSPNQSVCSGTIPGSITLSGHNGSVVYWQSASDSNFTNPTNISNTTTTLLGAAIGAVTSTVYYRAVIQNGGCSEVFSSIATILVETTTWNGVLWSNGAPSATKAAIFSGDYTSAGNLNACTINVVTGADVVISSGDHITISGALTVEPGSTYTQMDTASLVQVTNALNSGAISVKRSSSPLKRLDYILWSSPVTGQLLRPFSPLTLATRFYTYNAAADVYAAVSAPSTTAFGQGTGYLIRMPDNHPTAPTIWEGTFTGVPNNGTVDMPVTSESYNAVGNPYPSAIDADAFISANNLNEALYFWRKTNNAATTSYATYTLAGGVGTQSNSGDPEGLIPDGTIQVGQGFIAKAANGLLTFNNTMRISEANGTFLRSTLTQRHRVWLNLTNDEGIFSQTMFAYMEGATNEIDNAIDGHFINDSQTALTSIIENEEFAVQGRGVPFDHSDIVAIGFKTAIAGSYSISIAQTDGMFAEGQVIYLKDILLNITHNLSAGPYTFVSEAGVFNERFQIVYLLPLALEELSFVGQSVVIYKQGVSFVINTGATIMNSVQVFDIRGRLLVERKAVNASTTTFTVGAANQMLIVKITSDAGAIVTKKVMN